LGNIGIRGIGTERNYVGSAGQYVVEMKTGAGETAGDPTLFVQNNGAGEAAGFMGGNVGIGTAIGAAALHVWSGNISGSSTATGSFGSVHTAGNVGIGTNNPAHELVIDAAATPQLQLNDTTNINSIAPLYIILV